MSDEKKDQAMSEEEMAKMWEQMTQDGGEAPGIEEEDAGMGMPSQPAMGAHTDTLGLGDSLRTQNKTTTENPNIDFLLDIPLSISAELGRTKMIIYELLQLSQGSVIELNKLAGEPLDVRVNEKLIARGEAVVVNEKFGIRITDIVNPQERLENLKGE